MTLWGQPSAPSHCHQTATDGPCIGVPEVQEAFLTMPTSCPANRRRPKSESSVSTRADSWQEPGIWTPLPTPRRCRRRPAAKAELHTIYRSDDPKRPRSTRPTGVSIALKLPQSEAAGTLAESTCAKR